ncbi:MAG: flagellar motor switch protein FliN [Chloroflexi bacterium HGW-Chloroflexi-4]|jgi:flagellar motor switch protein FliN/FliY|nr:MAG: flagellar motor switch protein FliN [Chloroflexi bacterium HGW-Chloroflexi-4]
MDNNPAVSDTVTSGNNVHSANIDMLLDVPLTVTIELGRTEMTLKQALELNQGSVIELSRLAGDPIDVFVNERLIARGEVVVVDDRFAVRITELFSNTTKTNGQGEKA